MPNIRRLATILNNYYKNSERVRDPADEQFIREWGKQAIDDLVESINESKVIDQNLQTEAAAVHDADEKSAQISGQQAALVSVQWIDQLQGIGSGRGPSGETVHLSRSHLTAARFDGLYKGDKIRCVLSYGPNGVYASRIVDRF